MIELILDKHIDWQLAEPVQERNRKIIEQMAMIISPGQRYDFRPVTLAAQMSDEFSVIQVAAGN